MTTIRLVDRVIHRAHYPAYDDFVTNDDGRALTTRICEYLSDVGHKNTRQIAEKLHEDTKKVSTALGNLRKRGKVEQYGKDDDDQILWGIA